MEENLNNNSKKKMSGFKKIIIFIIVIAVISAIVNICNTDKNKMKNKKHYNVSAITNVVRNGSIESFPDVIFGDAFDNFFTKPTWLGYVREDNQKVVEFKGYASLNDKDVLIKILFKVDNQDFNIAYLKVDDEIQPKEKIVDWLRVIYTEYYRK